MKNNNEFIFLTEDADFTGEIEASNVILQGKIKGTVHAGHAIRLKPGSEIQGEIFTENLFKEDGSVHHGKLHILTSEKENGSDPADEENRRSNSETEETNNTSRARMNKVAAMLVSWSFW